MGKKGEITLELRDTHYFIMVPIVFNVSVDMRDGLFFTNTCTLLRLYQNNNFYDHLLCRFKI